jgi:hypothetical protein
MPTASCAFIFETTRSSAAKNRSTNSAGYLDD